MTSIRNRKFKLRWLGLVEFMGVLAFFMGVLLPLEGDEYTDGSVVILLGSVTITLVAFLAHRKNRMNLMISLILMFFGVAYLYMLSSYPTYAHAPGGNWWYLPGLTYPAGWVFTAIILSMRVFKKGSDNGEIGQNSDQSRVKHRESSTSIALKMANVQNKSPKKAPKRINRPNK